MKNLTTAQRKRLVINLALLVIMAFDILLEVYLR